MNKKPIHAPLTQFPVTDDQLIIGGMRLKQILKQMGGTPFYAYDSQAIRQRVSQLDIASAGELELALDSGMLPDNISFAGPGKTDGELRVAVEAGVTLNVESLNELHRIARTGEASGARPRVCLL